jgi:hypothetical protein
VRLFLDAHISARRIAAPLRDQGHDVRAADEQRELDGLSDERLLEIAVGETRAMITFDVKDLTVIAQRWAEAGRPHAGLGIVVGIDHSDFGSILQVISREISARPEQSDWTDLTLFIARDPAA